MPPCPVLNKCRSLGICLAGGSNSHLCNVSILCRIAKHIWNIVSSSNTGHVTQCKIAYSIATSILPASSTQPSHSQTDDENSGKSPYLYLWCSDRGQGSFISVHGKLRVCVEDNTCASVLLLRFWWFFTCLCRHLYIEYCVVVLLLCCLGNQCSWLCK